MFILKGDDILLSAAEDASLAVLFEHDGVAVGEDFQCVVNLQIELCAQILGDQHAPQLIDFADTIGRFQWDHPFACEFL